MWTLFGTNGFQGLGLMVTFSFSIVLLIGNKLGLCLKAILEFLLFGSDFSNFLLDDIFCTIIPDRSFARSLLLQKKKPTKNI